MQRRILLLTVGFIISLYAALVFLTKNPIALDDGLRHFVMAEKTIGTGVGSVAWSDFFSSGYFTRHRVDPWFLADLLYVPFTSIPDRIIGVKAAGFAFASFMILCFIPFIRLYKPITSIGVLSLLIFAFGSDIFAFRQLIARPFAVMTGIFLLTLFCIVRRRFWLLAPILLFSTLFSHLFVFPFFVCIVSIAWLMTIREHKSALRCAMFASAGVILGLLLHPWPIEYLLWLKNIFFVIPFAKDLGLGAEVYSGLGFADKSSFLLLAACVLLALRLALHQKLKDAFLQRKEILLYAVITICFFVAYMLWGRTLDFLWPIMVILLLCLATASDSVQRDVITLLTAPFTRFRARGIHVVGAMILISIGILAGSHIFGGDSDRNLAFADPVRSIPEGSTVFNLDWDFFPVFLFLNSSVRYVRGMDPTIDNENVRMLLRDAIGPLPEKQGNVFLRLYRELASEISKKQTSEAEMMTAEEARVWITDVKRAVDPDFIVFHSYRWKRLDDSLRQIPELTVFAKNKSLTVYRLSRR